MLKIKFSLLDYIKKLIQNENWEKFFKDVLVFKIDKYRDKRGSFFETYNETKNKKYFKKNFYMM